MITIGDLVRINQGDDPVLGVVVCIQIPTITVMWNLYGRIKILKAPAEVLISVNSETTS